MSVKPEVPESTSVKEEPMVPVSVLQSSVTKNVNARSEGGRWSWDTKQEVVQKMLVLGNTQLVSALTGVDASTITTWKKQDWYKELMASYRGDKALAVDAKMQAIVDKSLDIVADRLEHGDKVLNNKTGKIVSKPVSMKDAALVARDLMVRQQAIRKDENEDTVHKETTQDVLKSLAKEFAKWAKKDNSNAEDIPYVEQVKEE